MHHDVGDVAFGELLGVERVVGRVGFAGGVGGLAAQEDAGVTVHGRLVGGHGFVELPHDDGLRVVLEIGADAFDVGNDGDREAVELFGRPDAGKEEQTRGVDGASAENGLILGCESQLLAGLQGDVDAGADRVFDVDFADPGVRQNGQTRLLLVPTENGMDVRNRCARAVASVWVVGDGEKAHAWFEAACVSDLLVEVRNDGNVHGIRA